VKAYEVGEFAKTGQVRLVDREAPTPGESEALVRIRSTGPNARDFQIMSDEGMYKMVVSPNHIPFCDMAGDVMAVGAGVTSVAVGDRVTMTHYWRWLAHGTYRCAPRISDIRETDFSANSRSSPQQR
jgi:NADPH:quinone reductase-like Zn-dependent oxidoreductase